jgi:hypothetical protein
LPERYIEFIALPFGGCMSGYWLMLIDRRSTDHLSIYLEYWVLASIDDIVIGPSLGQAAKARDCRRASRLLYQLLHPYGLTRHPTKRVVGVGLYATGAFGICRGHRGGDLCRPERKVVHVMEKARALLKLAARNLGMVERRVVESFVGTVASKALTVPETAYYLYREFLLGEVICLWTNSQVITCVIDKIVSPSLEL